ncbi:MAG TPA: SGNH/GDSL hydrolase family protein [Gemmatimonadales bacterium]|nr:SGNH/GDSL hydrolase family protein [Gemmatimonadales bacterium]
MASTTMTQPSPRPDTGRTDSSPTLELARWKRVLFSLILLCFTLGTLELGARLYLRVFEGYDGKHLMRYVFDPYKNVLPTPNYVDTRGVHHNAQGFRRATEVPVTKPAGTYRIFLMGGSTAYGLGGMWPQLQRQFVVVRDSETISAYLERLLQDSLPGRKIEVINAAITSTWTHHHLIYLNQTILQYHPDMVLFLDGYNDFYFHDEGHDQFESYPYQSQSALIMGEPTLYSLLYMDAWWLFRRSAFANLTMRALRTVKQLLERHTNRTPVDINQAMAGLRDVFPRSALTMDRRIGLILRDAGVRAVFMLQPMLILERDRKPMPSIERKLFDFEVASYLPNYEQFMLQAVPYVRAQEEATARDVGATFLDLTGLYAGVSRQTFTDYCHLTPLGNAILARYVASRILPMIRHDVHGLRPVAFTSGAH